jgi:PAS domain S-box-containing protein
MNSTRQDAQALPRILLFVKTVAWISVATGAFAVVAWIFHADRWKFFAWVPPGAPATALCFALTGFALRMLCQEAEAPLPEGFRQRLARLCSVLVCLTTLGALAEHGLGREILFPSSARMAAGSALSLLMIGLGLILRDTNWRGFWLGEIAGIAALLISALPVFAFSYGARAAERLGMFAATAPYTAILLLATAAAVVQLRPRQGIAATLNSEHAGGVLIRRILPVVVAVSFASNWIDAGNSGLSPETALIASLALHVGAVAALLWLNARWLNQTDSARSLEQRKLEDAATLAGIGNWEWDLDTGEMSWSREMCELLHWDSKLGPPSPQDSIALVHPDDRTMIAEIHRKIQERLPSGSFEFRTDPARGPLRYLSARHGLTVTNGRATAIGVILDVTERRKSEEELERYAAIVESSDDAIIAKTLDGVVTNWNTGAERMFGYSALEMVGNSIEKLIPPDRRQEESDILGHIRDGHHVRHFETERIRKDGSTVDISVSVSPLCDRHGNIFGASKIARDITERKKAEQDLADSLREVQRMETAVNEHALVAITDTHGTITFVNDTFCRVSKFSREELVGQNHRIINSGYHSREFFRELWLTISKGRIWKGEVKNRAKDGSYYWVETTIVPFMDEKGRPQRYVALRTEVTTRKLVAESLAVRTMELEDTNAALKTAQQEIEAMNAQLEERVVERTLELKQLNHQLEAFSSSVSHDLRAPLRHIRGYAEILEETAGAGLTEESRAALQKIFKATSRMQELINDLLEFSRVKRVALASQWLDMRTLIEEVIEEISADSVGRNVEWSFGELPGATADAGLVRLIWVNLLSNALKFTRNQDPARIEVGTRTVEGATVYFVRDNGAGFDMRYVSKLFGVFERLHKEKDFEGTGIGLANVRQIVQRHGGRVWAEGALGAGATFFFTLSGPQKAEGSAKAATKEAVLG